MGSHADEAMYPEGGQEGIELRHDGQGCCIGNSGLLAA